MLLLGLLLTWRAVLALLGNSFATPPSKSMDLYDVGASGAGHDSDSSEEDNGLAPESMYVAQRLNLRLKLKSWESAFFSANGRAADYEDKKVGRRRERESRTPFWPSPAAHYFLTIFFFLFRSSTASTSGCARSSGRWKCNGARTSLAKATRARARRAAAGIRVVAVSRAGAGNPAAGPAAVPPRSGLHGEDRSSSASGRSAG